MPAFATLPAPLRTAVVAGYGEGIAVAAYALSILAFESNGSTSGIAGTGANLAPGILITIYLCFAALILGVTWLIMDARRVGFTPFLLVQAFGIVVAQPLLQASSTRFVGVVVIAAAAVALAGVLARSSRAALR